MILNLNKKKFAFLKAMIVSVLAILVFTVGNPAFAQPVFTDKLDLGLTSFYPDAASQQTKVNTRLSPLFLVLILVFLSLALLPQLTGLLKLLNFMRLSQESRN
jgi:hypothetical protein